MIRGKEWLTVPQAARLMGLSRQGALKRLKRLNRRVDDRLLQRDGEGAPWLVSVVVLTEMSKIHERDRTIDGIDQRLGEVEVKLLALRNSHGAFRRVTNKRLEKHENALKKLRDANQAVEEIFAEAAPDQETEGNSWNHESPIHL